MKTEKKAEKTKIHVMFVCTGNICRSPMAEAVFSHLVKKENLAEYFHIESSGTGKWHVGERPHVGTQKILKEKGVPLEPDKVAQQIRPEDFDTYQYIVAMDEQNLRILNQYGKAVKLLNIVDDAEVEDVPDPYYDGNFDTVFELVHKGSQALLDYIRREENL